MIILTYAPHPPHLNIWSLKRKEQLEDSTNRKGPCKQLQCLRLRGLLQNLFYGSVSPILIVVLPVRRCLKNYRCVCYLFAVALDGLCYLCLPMLQSFPLLVPFSCTFGYFDGAYVTLIPVVTAEIVGTTSLSSALGVVYFLHAVPYLVSPPIAGER